MWIFHGQILNITRKPTGGFVSEQVSREQFCCYQNHFHWMTSLNGAGLEWGVPKSTHPVFIYMHMEEVTHFTKLACIGCQIYTIRGRYERVRGPGLCCETVWENTVLRVSVWKSSWNLLWKLLFVIMAQQERSGDQHTFIFINWRHNINCKCYGNFSTRVWKVKSR